MMLYLIFKDSFDKWDYVAFCGKMKEESFVIFSHEENVLDILKGLNKTLKTA